MKNILNFENYSTCKHFHKKKITQHVNTSTKKKIAKCNWKCKMAINCNPLHLDVKQSLDFHIQDTEQIAWWNHREGLGVSLHHEIHWQCTGHSWNQTGSVHPTHSQNICKDLKWEGKMLRSSKQQWEKKSIHMANK